MSPAKVDVDLHLVNSDSGKRTGFLRQYPGYTYNVTVIASAMKAAGQEGIIAELPPGNYKFSVNKFGIATLGFCDTAMLAIAMAPTPSTARPCIADEALPDLKEFASTMLSTGDYDLPFPEARYTFHYGGEYHEVQCIYPVASLMVS